MKNVLLLLSSCQRIFQLDRDFRLQHHKVKNSQNQSMLTGWIRLGKIKKWKRRKRNLKLEQVKIGQAKLQFQEKVESHNQSKGSQMIQLLIEHLLEGLLLRPRQISQTKVAKEKCTKVQRSKDKNSCKMKMIILLIMNL